MQGIKLPLLFLVVFGMSFWATALIKYLAHRYSWMAVPQQDRWHRKPVALYGGVGFYSVFVLGALWVLMDNFVWELPWKKALEVISQDTALGVATVTGGSLMFFCGLWDDMRSLSPASKILWELVGASLFVFAGGVFPLTGIYIVNFLFTYFWFVGIINAVNMLDNMDGLSSGVVLISSMAIVILASLTDRKLAETTLVVPIGIVFIAALLGFWPHNRPAASIFMGDCGSLSMGYVLAALTVPTALNGFIGISNHGTDLTPWLILLIPVSVLAVPIFDTTLVTITRIWRMQKPYHGGRDHSSHRLVALGLSDEKAVLVLCIMAFFGGGVSILMQQFPDQSLPIFGFFGLALLLAGVYLGQVEVKTADTYQAIPHWKIVVTDLLYRRHAANIIIDIILIVLCFYGAYLLRFEGTLPEAMKNAFIKSLPLVVSSTLFSFSVAGIYSSQWRLISIADLPAYGLSAAGGTALSLAVVTLLTRFGVGHSRSAYIIFGLLLFMASVGSRLSFRLFDSLLIQLGLGATDSDHQPVLIYGAGKAGKFLYEEVMFNPQFRDYVVVGFIDDNPTLVGRKLSGLPIRTGKEWIRRPWNQLPEIWISSRSIPDRLTQELAEQWQKPLVIQRLNIGIERIQDAFKE